MSSLFVFGLGYSSRAIGALLRERGWRVAGTVRSARKFAEIEAEGLSPLLFDDSAGIKRALFTTSHCLVSTPPGGQADPVLKAHSHALLNARALRWIGYLSTIGVYGDRQGSWVDENTQAEPVTDRGAARIGAEEAWAAYSADRGTSLDIFRLSGIYGPGRSPIDRIREGDARRIIKPGQVFNRIHVADIAQTVVAAMLQDRAGGGVRLFNVTDDEPAPPQDVVLYAAQVIGAPPPPEVQFDGAELSPMARSFYADNKRVRNDKIKRDLGVRLRYPTYREGLRSLAQADDASRL
jgi:nucleoside-diphosphate-sugar epimerase